MPPSPSTTALPSVPVSPITVAGLPLSRGRSPRVIAALVTSGLLVQASLLLPAARGIDVPLGALVFALPLLALTSRHALRARWLQAAFLTASLGGLGMALGRLLDTPAGSTLEFCAVPGWRGGPPLFGWSTALMLASCLVCCVWLCPSLHRPGRWTIWLRHTMCLGAMTLGMSLAACALPVASTPLVMHFAMVAGMTAAAAIAHPLLYPPSHYAAPVVARPTSRG